MKPVMQPSHRSRPPVPRLPAPRWITADRRGGRRLLAGILLPAAVLAGLDTLLWMRAERTLDRRLDGLAATIRAAGWDLETGAGSRGGWPDAATLTLRHPTLRGGARLLPGGIAWSGDGVTLSLPLLRPRRATLQADGTQTVTLAPGLPASRTVRFWGAGLSARLPEDRAPAGDGLRLHADLLHVALAGTGPDDIARATDLTGRLRWPSGPPADGTVPIALSLFLRDLALPAPARGGEAAAARDHGDRIVQQVRLDAVLTGSAGTLGAPGSRLRIGRGAVDWGGSRVTLAGQAWLRGDGVLDGDFVLDAADPARVLRRMRGAGLVDAGTERAMQAVMGLVAAGEPGPTLRLPLLLRAGTLRLGEIPLLRVPGLPP